MRRLWQLQSYIRLFATRGLLYYNGGSCQSAFPDNSSNKAEAADVVSRLCSVIFSDPR